MIKTASSSMASGADWVRANYQPIFLSLILACISFPLYDLTYASGLDEPLPWMYNYFADGHFDLCRNILFPHGPLGFLRYPLPVGNNLYVATLFQLLSSFLLCFNVFSIQRFRDVKDHTASTCVLILLLAICDIQLLIIGVAASSMVLFHLQGKIKYLSGALLFCVTALYLKSHGGLICCLMAISQALYLAFAEKNYKRALLVPAVFLLFFFMFWIALYQTLSGSLTFLRGQYELSMNNSEAASYNQTNNWWLIGLSLALVLFIAFLSKNPLSRYFFWLMALPFFGAWKHAMARGEEIHIGGFLHFLILFLFLIWIIESEKKMLITILSLISISAFMLNLAINNDYSKQKNIGLFRAYNLYHLIADYDSIAVNRAARSADNLYGKELPDSIRRMIGKSSVDIYPWNYAYIAANGFNWKPRPVIHSYAAYTGWLDEQNLQHTLHGDPARFVLWELTDLDYNDRKFESIDYRYILNDQPKTLIAFFAAYRLKLKTEKYLLYEKRTTPLKISTSAAGPSAKIKFDEWVNVPASEKGSVLRAKLDISKSFMGALKSLIYKGEIVYVFYELENKEVYSHRIVPKNAGDGLWLDPLILRPENNRTEPPVKKIKIVCLNDAMVDRTVNVSFERIRFESEKTEKGNGTISEKFFGKNEAPLNDLLFSGIDKTEEVINPEALVKNNALKKSGPGLSPTFHYVLQPGQSSNRFVFRADPAQFKKDTYFLKFIVEGFVKAGTNTQACFVIGQQNRVLYSLPVKGNITENHTFWSYIYLIEKTHLSRLNLSEPFEFYLLNSDKTEKAELDDFSVKVEGTPY